MTNREVIWWGELGLAISNGVAYILWQCAPHSLWTTMALSLTLMANFAFFLTHCLNP